MYLDIVSDFFATNLGLEIHIFSVIGSFFLRNYMVYYSKDFQVQLSGKAKTNSNFVDFSRDAIGYYSISYDGNTNYSFKNRLYNGSKMLLGRICL